MCAQQLTQHLARQFLVVHDQRAQFVRLGLAHSGSPYSAGSHILTRILSSSPSAPNVASFPYRASTRLRTFFSPTPFRRREGASSTLSFSTMIPSLPSCTRASSRISP